MSLSPGGLSKFDWGYKSKDSNNTSDGGYKKDIIVRSFFNNIHNIVSKAQYVVKYEFKDLDKLAGALIDETYHKVGTNKSLVDVGHGIMRIAVQHHAVMEGIPNYQALNSFAFATASHKLKDKLHEFVFYDVKSGKSVDNVCLDAARAIIAVMSWELADLDEVVAAMQSFGLID